VTALRAAGLDGVQVSLLGSRARTHDELAGRSSWPQALEALANARAAGLSTAATFIATATNLDELPRMPELVSHLGVTRIVVNELQPVGSARGNLEALDVAGERFEAVVREAQVSAAAWGVRLNIVRFNAPAYTPTAGGWHRWSVSPDAQLKLCNHSSQTLGPLAELEDEDLDGLAHHLSTGGYAALAHRVDSCRCFAQAARGELATLSL
jgi:MoaA/NifB/PqqE/SkfB family radical SAM enzyme